MANVIKLRKGLDINLKGAAAQELVSVKEPGFYSLMTIQASLRKWWSKSRNM